MRLRIVCAATLVCATAFGQFRDLATTTDGARLDFISTLRQRGTDQGLWAKIFALGPEGVSLVFMPPKPDSSPYLGYSIDGLQAAGDGSWVLYGRRQNCVGGSSCFLNEQRSAVLVQKGGTATLGANARLSRDGGWLVSYSSPGVMVRYAWRTDRRTGTRVNLPAQPQTRPAVTPNGTVLIPAYDRLVLWDGTKDKTLAGRNAAAVMDDGATTVVYQTPEMRLRVVDAASGRTFPLGPDERDNWQPDISADGTRVLYLSRMYNGPQVLVSAPDGSGWRQLTDAEGGIREAVLSGDGRVAWAVTNGGAILRIDTVTGAVEARVAPTPSIASLTPLAPGSAADATGSRLDGAVVRVGDREAPVLYWSAGRLIFQVPWETAEGDTEVRLAGGDQAFEAAFAYRVMKAAPAAAVLAPCAEGCMPVIAIHEDFGSLVTAENPARPGEVVHLYVTGLGPVSPAVDTGAVTPVTPLSLTTLPFRWYWGDNSGADVLFAGLAPGLTGYYQVDVRVPNNVIGDYAYLSVNLISDDGGGLSMGLGFIPVRSSP